VAKIVFTNLWGNGVMGYLDGEIECHWGNEEVITISSPISLLIMDKAKRVRFFSVCCLIYHHILNIRSWVFLDLGVVLGWQTC